MQLGKYRHYKGKDYSVFDVAFDTTTDGKVVLYHALYDCPELTQEYGANPIFTRPYEEFLGSVEIEGKIVRRFEYIGE